MQSAGSGSESVAHEGPHVAATLPSTPVVRQEVRSYLNDSESKVHESTADLVI